MQPTIYLYLAGGSPTGTQPRTDVWVGRIRIINLDKFERLPFNWAISHAKCGYQEFRTLAAARKFAKTL